MFHHDALEFASGEIILLTMLVGKQYATVLQLPAQPLAAHATREIETAKNAEALL
jgi:hypothetical protein